MMFFRALLCPPELPSVILSAAKDLYTKTGDPFRTACLWINAASI